MGTDGVSFRPSGQGAAVSNTFSGSTSTPSYTPAQAKGSVDQKKMTAHPTKLYLSNPQSKNISHPDPGLARKPTTPLTRTPGDSQRVAQAQFQDNPKASPLVAQSLKGGDASAGSDLEATPLNKTLQAVSDSNIPVRLVALPFKINREAADGHFGALSEAEGKITREHQDLIKHAKGIIKRLGREGLTVHKNGKVEEYKSKGKTRQSDFNTTKAYTTVKRAVANEVFELGAQKGASSLEPVLKLLQAPQTNLYFVAHGDEKGIYGATGDYVEGQASFTPEVLGDLIDGLINPDVTFNRIDPASVQATIKIAACLSGTDQLDETAKPERKTPQEAQTDTKKLSKKEQKKQAKQERKQTTEGPARIAHSNFAARLQKHLKTLGYVNVTVRGYDGYVGEDSKSRHSYYSKDKGNIREGRASEVAKDYGPGKSE